MNVKFVTARGSNRLTSKSYYIGIPKHERTMTMENAQGLKPSTKPAKRTTGSEMSRDAGAGRADGRFRRRGDRRAHSRRRSFRRW